jgi:hypothetical protein
MRNALDRFEAKFVKTASCWEWTAALGNKGYGHFWFQGRPRPASQVSHLLYVGPIPEGMFVLHRCDNRKCVNPRHLFLGSNRENMDDMVRKGRQAKGEALGTAKLSAAQARSIRSDQRSQRVIGREYGISHTVVGQIKAGQIWRHA